jgi:hypothetical protein
MSVDDASRTAVDRLLMQCRLDELGLPADDADTAELAESYRLVGAQIATLYSAAATELLT